VNTGDILREVGAGYSAAESLAFSPNGLLLATGSGNGIVDLWRIDTLPALIRWVNENRYIRQLTCAEREQYNIEPRCDT